MALDPQELYEVDSDVPDLNGAVLLHHFEGFMDAGAAGRLLAEHLTETAGGRIVARFDIDGLIDYRSRRPTMTFAADHWEAYDKPELVVWQLFDADGTPFLLLTGPEPDQQWELFIAAVRSLIERWGVRLAVGFHGIPMGVPHTRPLGVVPHASRPELLDEWTDGSHPALGDRIQVPGSVSALLELRLGEAGLDAMGFAAHVPHYLAQSTYPTAAVTLLESVGRAAGLSFHSDELRAAAERVEIEINRQVVESTEVTDVVRALERQYDSFELAPGKRSLLVEEGQPLPTADELGSEFERFLAEQGPNQPEQ
ncbi:proteasome assembly chaperone family protein [Actinoalloteichus hymeniacidonis]|uniref:ATP-grasp superfamily enzyme n=1 Tax=Actinoalloteichus hymeniacidonis TaxID=340345 RepID=A0AAC9MZ31_9PSEU|nr:PAC2 family protein [Actinoalloteichus hymeniacidonis]AOS63930.1 ATP-grasp superfamily enzyme [Actinoalloteichus hymeniacidonis]MBB5908013.1 putative ATP-grasp superfamily ATP-dependent carboligase [Actinoalloteichus hymeniacidonis]